MPPGDRHGELRGPAVAEFQKILDRPGVVVSDPIGALARYQIGRAYAMAGETDKARSAYEDVLTLWKAADSDIRIVKRAGDEYAALRRALDRSTSSPGR